MAYNVYTGMWYRRLTLKPFLKKRLTPFSTGIYPHFLIEREASGNQEGMEEGTADEVSKGITNSLNYRKYIHSHHNKTAMCHVSNTSRLIQNH